MINKQLLMKSTNKNISSLNKKPHSNTANHYKSTRKDWVGHKVCERDTTYKEDNLYEEFTQFHLNDQQPESINAKRKLQEFSVQIQRDQNVVDKLKKNQNTINLLKKSQHFVEKQQNTGWVDTTHQKKRPNRSNKIPNKHRVVSSNNYMLQTSKYKGWIHSNNKSQKKQSLDIYNIQNNQNQNQNQNLNLSFNNLLPDDMQAIRQSEISRQIAKRAKSQHTNRPITAALHGTSRKIMNLYDKQAGLNSCKFQTMRIHSGKQMQKNHKNQIITFKNKDINLKTSLFSNYYSESKKSKEQNDKNARKGSKQSIQLQKNYNNMQNYKNLSQNNKQNYHLRSNSQPRYEARRNDNQQNQDRNTLSQPFRKNMMLRQLKSNLLSKKIRSHQLFAINDQKDQTKYDDQKINISSRIQNSEFHQLQVNKIKPHIALNTLKTQGQTACSENALKKVPKHNITQPPKSNLEHDFSLLINMLKRQSQTVLGGHLHNYLTQVNNNRQRSYYNSTGLNGKKNKKLHKNSTKGARKTLKTQESESKQKIKLFVSQYPVPKNNTSMHYTSFSTSKYKSRQSACFHSTSSSKIQL